MGSAAIFKFSGVEVHAKPLIHCGDPRSAPPQGKIRSVWRLPKAYNALSFARERRGSVPLFVIGTAYGCPRVNQLARWWRSL